MRRVSWWERFHTWLFGSRKTVPSVLDARTQLAATQRELADELEGAFISYQERLQDLAARLSVLDDEGILAEGETIRDAQQTLRRAVRRAALSERHTQELMNEWQDWERYAFHGPLAQTLVDERREMLRSELALRGVRLEKEPRVREEPVLNEPMPSMPTVSAPLLFCLSDLEPEMTVMVDAFPEWDEIISPAITNEVERWEKMLTDYPLEFGDAAHLADLMHRRRAAHARYASLGRFS